MRTNLAWPLHLALLLATPHAGWATVSSTNTTLTHTDIYSLGSFLADLARSLYVTIVSVCVYYSHDSVKVYERLASVLARKLVFILPCHTHQDPQPFPLPCPAHHPRPSDASSWLDSCHQRSYAHIQVTEPGQAQVAERKAVEGYGETGGEVRQVVVGPDLQPNARVEAALASWILASYSKATQRVAVQEVFTFPDSPDTVVEPLGEWRPRSRLALHYPPGRGPRDFQGHVVTLASFPYPPFIMEGTDCPSPDYIKDHDLDYNHDPRCVTSPPPRLVGGVVFVGYLMEMFNTLAHRLNFTYRVLLPAGHPDNYTFGMGRSDNFSGLVGMIYRREADIALASLSISQERLELMDFSVPVDHFVRNLYIRSNAILSTVGWGTYAWSFSGAVWVMVVVSLAATSLCLWFLSRFEASRVPREILSLNDIFFMFYSCLVQQGVPTTPDSLRGRSVFWIFWVSSVVLYANYTALLTSYLTVSTQTPPFTSFPAAVASYPQWQIGIMRGTPLRQFLKDAQGETYQLLSSRFDADPGLIVDGETRGVARLLKQNYAFLTDDPLMKYAYDNCSIKVIQTQLFPTFGRIGYVKNLPFAGILDQEVSMLSDGGVLDRMRRHWWGRKVPCEEATFTNLDFTHTATAFVILLAGLILAVLLLFLERVYWKKVAHTMEALMKTPTDAREH